MSTSLDLSSYNAIRQATFVKIVTDQGTILMSSHNQSIVLAGDTYPAVGDLLGISDLTNELKASQSEVTITLSGIPSAYMTEVLTTPIKGSYVEIRRAFFNVQTSAILNIPGNPVLEFSGIVNNFNIDEGWTDDRTQTVTSTISLSCSSIMSVLINKVSGRRTNHADQDFWFEGDLSMDRVSVIADAVFDFGGTTPGAAVQTPTSVSMVGTG